MKKEINVTIIVIVRNNWKQIERCLKSLLRQPGVTKEIILLNDGSDDGSSKEIKVFADNNSDIKLFEQKYKGLANSRNKAIRQIQGRYTIFVNQDQELMPYALQLAYKEAARCNADMLQLSYMVRSRKRPKHMHLKRMPRLRNEVNGAEYVKAVCGKMMLPTDNYTNMIRSDYLKEKMMRFDHRLTDYDFDFFTKAIIGAESVATSPYPLFIINRKETLTTKQEGDPVRTLTLENEFIRKNFNEFAENNYLSNEKIKLLRYSRFLHMLGQDRQLLAKTMQPKDYIKWVKATKGYLFMFGGWKRLSRIRQYFELKATPTQTTNQQEHKKEDNNANTTNA